MTVVTADLVGIRSSSDIASPDNAPDNASPDNASPDNDKS